MNLAYLSPLLAVGLALAGLLRAAETPPRPPNVLIILTDDLGWGDLALHGNPNLRTPRLDAFAREGIQFRNFFVQPVCSPSRAEILTGRYHPRGGVYDTGGGGERLNEDEQTIADVFHAAGYRTACFGKWHNGAQPPYHPNSRGFDEFYGFTSGHWGMYFEPTLDHNGTLVKGRGFLADDLTDHAIDSLTAAAQPGAPPSFVYLALNTPHSPMQVPDEYWAAFKDKPLAARGTDADREDPDHTRAALAMVENIDWNVGRLLDAVERTGQAENTIVLFLSDNGPNGHRWNGGMKGIKASTDEGGVRSPLILRWPKHLSGGRTIDCIAGAIDLLPTLAELAKIPARSPQPLDGISLAPLLTGAAAAPDRLLFSYWNGLVSVRSQNFRLDAQGALFDMERDPGQHEDIAQSEPLMALRLQRAVAAWREDVLAHPFDRDRPYPIGASATIPTSLSAGDATFSGGIERSNRFPNDSYLRHWTGLTDRIEWRVDVRTAGRYAAALYYTCPAADVGGRFVLRFADRELEGRIVEPHDPPLRGASDDRIPRQESYVKDFRRLDLGTIEFPKASGQLTLQALEIPGNQVMDFQLLVLNRLP